MSDSRKDLKQAGPTTSQQDAKERYRVKQETQQQFKQLMQRAVTICPDARIPQYIAKKMAGGITPNQLADVVTELKSINADIDKLIIAEDIALEIKAVNNAHEIKAVNNANAVAIATVHNIAQGFLKSYQPPQDIIESYMLPFHDFLVEDAKTQNSKISAQFLKAAGELRKAFPELNVIIQNREKEDHRFLLIEPFLKELKQHAENKIFTRNISKLMHASILAKKYSPLIEKAMTIDTGRFRNQKINELLFQMYAHAKDLSFFHPSGRGLFDKNFEAQDSFAQIILDRVPKLFPEMDKELIYQKGRELMIKEQHQPILSNKK